MVVFAIDNAGGAVKQLYEQGRVPRMIEHLAWTHGGPVAAIGCGRGREGSWEDHAAVRALQRYVRKAAAETFCAAGPALRYKLDGRRARCRTRWHCCMGRRLTWPGLARKRTPEMSSGCLSVAPHSMHDQYTYATLVSSDRKKAIELWGHHVVALSIWDGFEPSRSHCLDEHIYMTW